MNINLKIVIVSLNLKEDTLACIDSLIQAGAALEELIVVDNGSTDGTVEAIHNKYGDKIAIIANAENVGLSLAYDQGAQRAFDQGVEWVLLINNDTEVAPDFFSAIEQALAKNQDYQLFHPAVMYYSDPDIIWHIGSKRIPGTLIWRDMYRGKPYSPEWPELLPMDCISSCAMLIPREVYEKVGLFEPKFIIYWDEVDFCWRAHLAGYRMAAITKARVWHKVSKTMNQTKPRARYLYIRNQLYFYRKSAHGLQRPLMYAFLLYKSLLTIFQDLHDNRRDLVRPLVNGWSDGWRGF
jgi:GT2 family glycosyltransferase